MDKSENKLNILEVCFSDGQGGLEMYMADVSRRLQARGHRVHTAAPEGSYLAEKLRANRPDFTPLNPGRRYLDFGIAGRLAEIIREKDIDIIHAHQSTDLSSLILAKHRAGRGCLVFTQQMESSRRKKDLFHRWVYRNLDGLITITDRIERQVLENTPVNPARVWRLYYGIDTGKFSRDETRRREARKKYGIAEEETAVGIVGRLEEGKGQHVLLQAAGRLKDLLPRLKVLIIGGETVGQQGYLRRLRSLVLEAGLQEKVIFTGFQSDVTAVSAALDIFVLATRKETFGLSLVEAMAQGIAPVATDAGGVPEIITHRENGLLVPPFDSDALAAALRQLIEQPEFRRRMAENALQTVRHKFELSAHLNGLEKIFFHLTGQ